MPEGAEPARGAGGKAACVRYTPELGREICARVAAGESQHALAREPGMPSRRTFRDWALREPEFGAAFEAANPGVKNLDVKFKDGPVQLSGDAITPEAMEKAVLLAGNVQGVEKVSADQLKSPPQTGKVEYYTIQSGDTLSSIAKKFLGNASAYPKIFEANREVIKDPDKIYVGQKIRIPLG